MVLQKASLLPTHHSHSQSEPAELDVRVLLANAARSAPGSPKAAAPVSKADSPFARDEQSKLASDKERLADASAEAPKGETPEAAVVENLNQLLRIVSGELSAERSVGTPVGSEAAAMSAADRDAIGHLARGLGSQTNLAQAHSAPMTDILPRALSPVGRMGTLGPEDDTQSIVSAPGIIEDLHQASFGDSAQTEPGAARRDTPRPGVAGRVSRYMSMIESRNLMISMPAWERPILRHNSTDLVLRFLNRHAAFSDTTSSHKTCSSTCLRIWAMAMPL